MIKKYEIPILKYSRDNTFDISDEEFNRCCKEIEDTVSNMQLLQNLSIAQQEKKDRLLKSIYI